MGSSAFAEILLHFAFQNLNTDTDCIGNEETALA